MNFLDSVVSLHCTEVLDWEELLHTPTRLFTPTLEDVYYEGGGGCSTLQLDDFYGPTVDCLERDDNLLLLLGEQAIPHDVVVAVVVEAALTPRSATPKARVCEISPRKRKTMIEDPEYSVKALRCDDEALEDEDSSSFFIV